MGPDPAGALNFDDLNAALDAMSTQPSTHNLAAGGSKARATGGGGGVSAPAAARAAEPSEQAFPPPAKLAGTGQAPALPGFVLCAEVEGSQPNKRGSARQRREEEEAHLQQLLQQYERMEQGAAASGSGATGAALAAAAAAAGACLPEAAEAGAETWAGEGYEADAVLHWDARRASDAAQIKFLKRLARGPDQCARYRQACGCRCFRSLAAAAACHGRPVFGEETVSIACRPRAVLAGGDITHAGPAAFVSS